MRARNQYFDLLPILQRYRRGASRVTDVELIAIKLALIETYVHELKTLADASRIEVDVREERFVEHTLQMAVQAALVVASHVASDQRWENRGRTRSYSSSSPSTGGSMNILLERCERRPDWI